MIQPTKNKNKKNDKNKGKYEYAFILWLPVYSIKKYYNYNSNNPGINPIFGKCIDVDWETDKITVRCFFLFFFCVLAAH